MARTQDITKIVGRIYDAALASDHWDHVLCELADFCGVANAALVTVDPDSAYSSVISPRANPDSVGAYNQHWWRYDPLSAVAKKAPVGKYVSIADINREAYFASAFYNEFRRFTGYGDNGLTTTLFHERNAISTLVFQTSQRADEIDARSLRKIDQVVPHVGRAAAIARAFRRTEVMHSVAAAARAPSEPAGASIIIVNIRGGIVFADAGGEALLAKGRFSIRSDESVSLGSDKADAALRRAIKTCAKRGPEALAGDRIELQGGEGQTSYIIDILPWHGDPGSPFGARSAALLLISDRRRPREAKIEHLRDRFGLTRAEAGLALEIIRGDGRAAAAARCGISVNTARTHLMHIFQKTGVSRQAELIRLVMGAME